MTAYNVIASNQLAIATYVKCYYCLFMFYRCKGQVTQRACSYMPFYRLYTPRDIRVDAELTGAYYNYSTTAITFTGGSATYSRLFKLPLLARDLLTYSADITVKITVGLQNDIRSHDSDPKLLLSDGDSGVGFEMREEAVRCQGIQGLMGDVLSSRSLRGGASHESSTLPEQFILTIKPSRAWGSCYFAVDSGLISPVYYTRGLDLRKGLWLELYGENTGERYLINYIIVEIHEN